MALCKKCGVATKKGAFLLLGHEKVIYNIIFYVVIIIIVDTLPLKKFLIIVIF